MKKVLSTAAALGLVFGVATTASALDFSVKGEYSLVGASLSTGNGTGGRSNLVTAGAAAYTDGGDDSFWFSTMKFDPTLKVNDAITLKADIRFDDRAIWGLGTAATTGSLATGNPAAGRDVDVSRAWMEYASPVGSITMGRVLANPWYGPMFNSYARGNRIIWVPNMVSAPWKLTVLYQKATEVDILNSTSDGDQDIYYAGLEYNNDIGKTAVALAVFRQAADTGLVANATVDTTLTWQSWRYYGMYKLGSFNVEAEIQHQTGDATSTIDLDANGGMIDISTKVGDATVGLLYFFMSGDNENTDTERSNILTAAGVGNDWNPYLILTGDWLGILNADRSQVNDQIVDDGSMAAALTGYSAGVHSIGLHASMPVSPKAGISAALGTAWADVTPNAADMTAVGAAGRSIDDDFGWELDLGFSYKLLDNLTYGAHFGYLNTGKYFEDMSRYVMMPGGTAAIATANSEDVIFLAHGVTMKF